MPSSGSTELATRAPERVEAIRDGDALKIAFFVSTFPSLSQTFILRQITGLIDRGHAVDIYALGPGQEGKTHPEVAAYKLRACTSYPEIPPLWSRRFVGGLRLIASHPLKGLRALNLLRYGGNAASLRLLHQAARLWPSRSYDILHAHFGPNGIRAAMLRDAGAL